jgi:hypothetical protein
MNNDTIIGGSGSDSITISIDSTEWNWNDNMSGTGFAAQEITTVLPGSVTTQYSSSDTITLSGLDDIYTSPTKADHNELKDRVERLEKIMAEEAEIRAQSPAVKNAYDEYRLLLVLAKQHTSSPLTEE